MFHKQFAVFVK